MVKKKEHGNLKSYVAIKVPMKHNPQINDGS